jgi:hypothetical protein
LRELAGLISMAFSWGSIVVGSASEFSAVRSGCESVVEEPLFEGAENGGGRHPG